MTRARSVVGGLWAVLGVLLIAAVLAATARDETLQVAAQNPCVPTTLPVTVTSFPVLVQDCASSITLPTSTTTPEAATSAPTPTTSVTTTTAYPRAPRPVMVDDQLVLPPGDYDRLAVLTAANGSGVRARAGARALNREWQVTVVAEGLTPGGDYHFMVGRKGTAWPTPCMLIATRSGRGTCTGRVYGDAMPPEMVALMGPSGLVQAEGAFL